MSNPDAILGVIGDLYGQITHLAQENAELRKLLSEKADGPEPSTDDLDGLYRT